MLSKMINQFQEFIKPPDLIISKNHENEIPFDKTGVYIIYTSDQGMAYIGKSKDLRKRILYQHLKSKDPSTKIFIKKFSKLELYYCDTEVERDLLEILLINKYSPPYNKEFVYDNQKSEQPIVPDKLPVLVHISNVKYARKYAQFLNTNHFNSNLRYIRNRFSDLFTKSEIICLNTIQRYAVKYNGVAFAKISTFLKTISEDNNGIGVSRKTFERMLVKAKENNLIKIIHTFGHEGKQHCNIYVFVKHIQ